MKTSSEARSFLHRLHEVLFSLNIGFAVTFSLLAYISEHHGPAYSRFIFAPAADVFIGSAVKVRKLLRLDPFPDVVSLVGNEIISIALILLLATLAFLFLRLAGRTALLRTILLYPVGGVAALALVPALWWYAILRKDLLPYDGTLWRFGWRFGWPAFAIEVPLVCAVYFLARKRRIPVWGGLLVLILVPILHYTWWLGFEFILICAFFFLPRKRRISVWGGLLVLGLHYAWWLFVLSGPIDRSWAPWVSALCFVLYPGSGIAWFFCVRELQRGSEAPRVVAPVPRPHPTPLVTRVSRRKLSWRILLVVAGLLIPIAVVIFRLRAALPAQEREALIALYNRTDGANWKDNTYWLGAVGTECIWYGVTCNSARTNITSLSLDFNQLNGSIPTQLGNLTHLYSLDLSGNQLSGSIPAELGNLTSLRSLHLSRNQLSGSIPAQLGNLTNLKDLDLYSNQLSGTIPTQLGNLTNLGSFELGSNQLSGGIPAQLGNLTKLYDLSLGSNQLSGRIPTQLGNLTNLYLLGLGYNQLSGSIPAQLGNLTNLRSLKLGSNRLSGSTPAELGNLTNLQSLDLHSNQLSGSIPAQLGNLTNLESLTLFSNQLSGSIPARLANLTKLSDLNISYNALFTNDSSLVSFLNSKCASRLFPGPGWQKTQTIAPVGFAAHPQSASLIQVSWTPIAYSSDPGRYIVLQSTLRGGPYSLAGSTASKTASSLAVTGLRPSTTYYFVVQTVTDPHTNNRNTVASEYSSEVSAATY